MILKPILLLSLTLTALTIFAGAKEDPAAAGLVGAWDAKGTAPNGEVRGSVLTFEMKDGKLHCVANGDQGEMRMDSVTLDGKKVVIRKEYDSNGNRGSLTVDATEKNVGKLTGKWIIEPNGGEKISGAWEATKRKSAELKGSWLAGGLSENGGDPYPFILKFKGSGEDLSVTSTTDQGTRQLQAVKFDGKTLSFDSKVEIEDGTYIVSAKADIQQDGTLAGTYQTKRANGDVVDKGTWTSAPEKKRAEKKAVEADGVEEKKTEN